MFDEYNDLNFRALMHLKKMREEALELYDYCLTEGNITPLVKFIEEQLAADPPPLILLYEVAEDIQQRFVALRENHYDVRNQVIQTLKNLYQANVTQLFPADQLDNYHNTELVQVLDSLTAQGIMLNSEEQTLLSRLIRQSCETAEQLYGDIVLTEALQEMINDWLYALAGTAAREYTSIYNFVDPPQPPMLH